MMGKTDLKDFARAINHTLEDNENQEREIKRLKRVIASLILDHGEEGRIAINPNSYAEVSHDLVELEFQFGHVVISGSKHSLAG